VNFIQGKAVNCRWICRIEIQNVHSIVNSGVFYVKDATGGEVCAQNNNIFTYGQALKIGVYLYQIFYGIHTLGRWGYPAGGLEYGNQK